MKFEKLQRAWPIFASLAMLLLAFPPFNVGLLVFVALTPWLVSLKSATPRESLRSGYLFGFLYMAAHFVWLFQFVDKWTGNPGLSLIPMIVCSLIGGLYFLMAARLIHACWAKNMPWLIPLVWTGIEVFRSFVPGLAFPWGLVHTPLWPYPSLLQMSAYGTAYFVSAMVVLVNVALALMLLKAPWREVRLTGFPALILFMASFVRFGQPIEGDTAEILVAQPGVDMAFQDPVAEENQLRDAVGEFLARAQFTDADFIVFPEGMMRSPSWPPVPPFAVSSQPPMLFGGQRGPGPVYQSAFAFDGNWTYADKRRLVIFGEYVPGRNVLPFLSSFELPAGDLTPAEKTSAVKLGKFTVGPLICFEGLFADVALDQAENGAQVLTVMSVDDWYMGTPAPEQLAAASVFRAIETGLPLVRSAGLGYSQAVDQRGRITNRAPLKERYLLSAKMLVPKSQQMFAGIRVFPYLSLLACIVIYFLPVRSKSQADSPQTT